MIPLGNKNIQPDARDLRLLLMMDNTTPETMSETIIEYGLLCDVHCEATRNWFAGEGSGATIDAGGGAAENIGIGYNALNLLTTGDYQTVVGCYAGAKLTTSQFNCLIGYYAGNDLTTTAFNTMVGSYAGVNASGANATQNTYVGHASGNNMDGDDNVCVGYRAGYGGASTGVQNVFIGSASGDDNTSASQNTCVGFQSGFKLTTGDGNVFVGYMAGWNQTTEDDELFIDNSNNVVPLIHGEFDNSNVGIKSDVYMGGTHTLSLHESTTAPAGGAANTCCFYVNGGEMYVINAAGAASQLSSHDPDGKWIFHSINTITGEEHIVDMEALVCEVEKLTGKTFTERRGR